MINVQYIRANDVADAVRQIAADPAAKFIAGGTNLIDLMKEDVERPTRLIDITRLPLKSVEETAGGCTIFTLPPPFLTELFTQANHLNFEARIREQLPAEVMSRLFKVPYFTAAFEPDGLDPNEFNQIPALLNTWKEFKAAMDKIVAFTAQAMRVS